MDRSEVRSRRLHAAPGAALAVIALIAAGIAFAPVPAAFAAGGANPDRGSLDQAVAFRERLGLRSERAFVASTFGNQAFADRAWGAPLSAAESSEVRRRADVQVAVGKALSAAAADARSAGAYFDQAAGGIPVFLTAGEPARARAAVRGKLPDHVAARFLHVARSTAELEALQERINADLRGGDLRALGVTSTAIDARANAVVVGAVVASDQMGAELAARYGAGVQLVAEAPAQGGDACTTRDNCLPAKGGIEIVSSYNGNNCTTGFMVRVANDNAVRVLTAGHCVGKTGGTGTSRKWRSHGIDLGWSEFATWTNGSDADAGIINPYPEVLSGDRNLAYAAASNDIRSIHGWKATAEQVQGSLICRAAVVSNYVCGTIELTNRTKDVDGRTIDHQWVVDFDACPGDSGAPYLNGDIGWGIHSDSTVGCEPGKNQAWYSPLGWVFDVLAAAGHPISLCTEATCGANINHWTARGSLPVVAERTSLVPLPGGRVLGLDLGSKAVLAAAGTASGPVSVPQRYDAGTGAWSAVAEPPWLPTRCIGQFAVGLDDGRVLVGGGAADGGGSDPCAGAAFLFDPGQGQTGSWTAAAAMPAGLLWAGAALLADGRALVAGMTNDGTQSLALAYDPDTDEWATLAAPPALGDSPVVERLGDGRVVAAGTATGIYTPGTNAWAASTSVGADGAAGVALSDGRVVVAGGRQGSGSNTTLRTTVSVFTPSTSKWTQVAALKSGRADFALRQLGDGRLIAVGGLLASGSAPAGAATKTADVYDWTSNAWYPAASLLTARVAHGSAILASGDLLVAGGSTTSSETYTRGDVIPPVASAPSTRLRSGATLGSTVPITVSWGAATDTGGAGTGTYELARSTDGGGYSTIATSITGTSHDTTVSPGHTYRFEVRARDWAGNFSPWKAANSTMSVGVTQNTSSKVAWTGSWTTSSYSSYSGGSVRYSKSSGAKASYLFTARSVSFVTERGPARGSAKIYIDGVLAATVSTYASTTSYRYVAFQKTWSSSGQHRISVVVSGTSGHPRVDVDAFVFLTGP